VRAFSLGLGLLAAAALVTAIPVRAQHFEGTREFGISLWAPEGEVKVDEWAIAVTVWNAAPEPGRDGQVRISVGGAGTAIDGDGPRRIPVRKKGPLGEDWSLRIRRNGTGRVEVHGEVRFPGATPSSYELHEALLVFEVSESSVRLVESRTVRQISVRDGRKFRYAGPFLVALDDNDDEDPSQVEARPQLMQGPVIYCGGCGLLAPVEIPVVVTVGKGGKVTWVSAIGRLQGKIVSEASRSAIESGLAQFHFRPATSKGRPIADYASLTVTLAPQ